MAFQRHALKDKYSATTIVSSAPSLTVGRLSNPSLVELSCLGKHINPETGSEIGGPGRDGAYNSVAIVVVGA